VGCGCLSRSPVIVSNVTPSPGIQRIQTNISDLTLAMAALASGAWGGGARWGHVDLIWFLQDSKFPTPVTRIEPHTVSSEFYLFCL
jgi:hypothetical protein